MTERKKQITDLFAFGKIPPQAKDLENAVLGAILLDKEAIGAVIEILQPECFYAEQNKKNFLKRFFLFTSKATRLIYLLLGSNFVKMANLNLLGGNTTLQL